MYCNYILKSIDCTIVALTDDRKVSIVKGAKLLALLKVFAVQDLHINRHKISTMENGIANLYYKLEWEYFNQIMCIKIMLEFFK